MKAVLLGAVIGTALALIWAHYSNQCTYLERLHPCADGFGMCAKLTCDVPAENMTVTGWWTETAPTHTLGGTVSPQEAMSNPEQRVMFDCPITATDFWKDCAIIPNK